MKYLLLTVILFLSLIESSKSQTSIHYLPLETIVYDYLDYQINSGKKIPKFVFRQPYELDRDYAFKNNQSNTEIYFDKYWRKYYSNGNTNLYLLLGDLLKKDEAALNFYNAAGGIYYKSKHLTLANQVTFDENYKNDRFFAGDLSESEHWLYGRINEAYLNLNFSNFDFFIGRTKRNWGPIGEKSLILSNNPYSYDHLLFNYTTNSLKFSLIYAQLENLDALSKEQSDAQVEFVNDARKYMVGHRLDWRIKNNLQIAFTEMATYGGHGRDFELAFMNPTNFYYPIQRNDRKQMDGFWAMDIFYKPVPRLSVYTQFLIDDIIVNNEPGQNDRARYPDRFAAMLSIRNGDAFIKGLNIGLTYVRVWNRTYQSKYTYENYHYRGLGLGYPCAGCEEIKLKMAYWGFFPFFFQNELIYGRYGDVALTDLFPLINEDFPLTPVSYNLINELKFYYFHNTSLRLFASFIYRDNPSHYLNRLGEKNHFILSVGLNILLTKSFNID